MKWRRWTDEQLRKAVRESRSIRQTLGLLGLVPAGGNYDQVHRRITELHLSIKHMTGKGWNKGLFIPRKAIPLSQILKRGSKYQSYKLKRRLFATKIKKIECEQCGWAKKTADGRIPLELDHVNGDRNDNRLVNLRILCPNCHSLQPTHRGLNQHRRT
jgi:hypothetical protein